MIISSRYITKLCIFEYLVFLSFIFLRYLISTLVTLHHSPFDNVQDWHAYVILHFYNYFRFYSLQLGVSLLFRKLFCILLYSLPVLAILSFFSFSNLPTLLYFTLLLESIWNYLLVLMVPLLFPCYVFHVLFQLY